jgi:hypothetical protein
MDEAAEVRQRQFDRDHAEQATEAWGRGWLEARRRGPEERELNWYRLNWRNQP